MYLREWMQETSPRTTKHLYENPTKVELMKKIQNISNLADAARLEELFNTTLYFENPSDPSQNNKYMQFSLESIQDELKERSLYAITNGIKDAGMTIQQKSTDKAVAYRQSGEQASHASWIAKSTVEKRMAVIAGTVKSLLQRGEISAAQASQNIITQYMALKQDLDSLYRTINYTKTKQLGENGNLGQVQYERADLEKAPAKLKALIKDIDDQYFAITTVGKSKEELKGDTLERAIAAMSYESFGGLIAEGTKEAVQQLKDNNILLGGEHSERVRIDLGDIVKNTSFKSTKSFDAGHIKITQAFLGGTSKQVKTDVNFYTDESTPPKRLSLKNWVSMTGDKSTLGETDALSALSRTMGTLNDSLLFEEALFLSYGHPDYTNQMRQIVRASLLLDIVRGNFSNADYNAEYLVINDRSARKIHVYSIYHLLSSAFSSISGGKESPIELTTDSETIRAAITSVADRYLKESHLRSYSGRSDGYKLAVMHALMTIKTSAKFI